MNPSRRLPSILVAAAMLACGCATYSPVRTHFNKGVRLYDEGNYSGAAREYRLAIEEDPMDHRSHFNLGVTLEELGQKDLARAEYEWILSIRPDDLRASVNLAALEIESGAREVGYARLQGMVDRYGTLAMPRIALATHYVGENRLDDAETLVRQGLARDPSDIEGNFLLGTVLVRKAEAVPHDERCIMIAEARKAFETSLANAPNDVPTLLALGRLERQEGRAQLARSYFRRVAMLKSSSAEAHAALADLEEEAGSLEAAAEHLWEVRKIDKKRTEEVAARLVRIYAELGRQAEAVAASRPAPVQP